MLEHATYLETVALRLHHDAVQTISATLVGTNTTKLFDLLEGTFGVDLPKDDEEVESVSEEEEEHLPQTGMTSHAAAQSADTTKFSAPVKAHLLLTHDLPRKLKAKVNNKRKKGQRLNGSLK